MHAIRRSLVMFIVNIFELSLYSTVVLILINCSEKIYSQWLILYENLSANFSLSLSPSINSTCCSITTHFQLITAAALISITIASLVRGLREEIDDKKNNAS